MNLVASLREILDQRVLKEGVIVVNHLRQPAKVFVDAIEVDEFENGLQLVVMAQLVDFFLGGFLLGKHFNKLVDGEIVDQGVGADARFQHEAFQRGATAEGDIDLSVRKGLSRIDDDFVKSKTLALVDGDRPSQTQRDLGKAADFLFFDILVISIDGIFHVLPFQLRHSDTLAITQHGDSAFLFIVAYQPSDFAVKESLFRGWVVFDKHHLRSNLQFELFLGRIGVFGEGAMDICLESQRLFLYGSQLRLIDLIGLVVVGGQSDVAFLVIGHEAWFEAAVEHSHTIGIHLVVAHFIQQ